MKKTIINILLVVIVLFLIFYGWVCKSNSFDTKPYETKIDSLNVQIDSINKENESLENYIGVVELDNRFLVDKVVVLNEKIVDLKGDLKEAKSALSYTPTQVDSFFVATYPKEYSEKSIDTTHLPIEVSKAAIVDIKEGQINAEIVVKQDSVIQDLNKISVNKDTIIFTLRNKESNYLSIIDKKDQQEQLYKVQITGLKDDLKRTKKKLLFGKIQKIILGAGVAGLIILK